MLARAWNSRWLPAGLVAGALAFAVSGTPSCSRPEGPVANLHYVLQDMNGKPVNLESLKGRPILLNFWATWCPPCKAEIPWFMEFSDKYQAYHLAVIGVSVDDSAEDIRAFAAANHINYPLLVGEPHREFRTGYEANELIPISWLIRPDGTVLAKAQGIHPKEWFESNLKTMFADAEEF